MRYVSYVSADIKMDTTTDLSLSKKQVRRLIDFVKLTEHPELFRTVLQSLCSSDRMKLLHQYIDPGETLLHVVASYDDPGLMEIVLESVSEEQHYDLLSEGDNYIQTPTMHVQEITLIY